MNRRILIISVFCFSCIILCSDPWVQTYRPFGYDANYYVENILVCSDGGYAVNGHFTTNEPNQWWGYVMKTDCDGNLLWAKPDTVSFQVQNESHAMIETDDGGIISAAYRMAGGTAMIKRDADGNREWVNFIENIYIKSISHLSDENLIVTGYNYEDWPMIAKINQNADLLWSQTFSFDNYDWGGATSVNLSSDGGYLIAGRLTKPVFDRDALIIKTNSEGDSLWSRIYSTDEIDDYASCIIEVNDNNILVGGYTYNTHGIFWKLDSNGNTIWLETPQETHTNFYKTSDNNILSLSGWGENKYVNKLDGDCNIIWANEFQYGWGAGDKTISETLDDHIVVPVWINGSIGIVKLNSDGTSIEEEIINASLSDFNLNNYPNPFNPSTTISFDITAENSKVSLTIYNLKGQKIKTLFNNELEKGNHSIIWNGNNDLGIPVSSGIYYYKLEVNGKTEAVIKCLLLK